MVTCVIRSRAVPLQEETVRKEAGHKEREPGLPLYCSSYHWQVIFNVVSGHKRQLRLVMAHLFQSPCTCSKPMKIKNFLPQSNQWTEVCFVHWKGLVTISGETSLAKNAKRNFWEILTATGNSELSHGCCARDSCSQNANTTARENPFFLARYVLHLGHVVLAKTLSRSQFNKTLTLAANKLCPSNLMTSTNMKSLMRIIELVPELLVVFFLQISYSFGLLKFHDFTWPFPPFPRFPWQGVRTSQSQNAQCLFMLSENLFLGSRTQFVNYKCKKIY